MRIRTLKPEILPFLRGLPEMATACMESPVMVATPRYHTTPRPQAGARHPSNAQRDEAFPHLVPFPMNPLDVVDNLVPSYCFSAACLAR